MPAHLPKSIVQLSEHLRKSTEEQLILWNSSDRAYKEVTWQNHRFEEAYQRSVAMSVVFYQAGYYLNMRNNKRSIINE